MRAYYSQMTPFIAYQQVINKITWIESNLLSTYNIYIYIVWNKYNPKPYFLYGRMDS